MFQDLVATARLWRLVHLHGVSALRARYARSRLGQAWLSVTMFAFILCVGIIWSQIWRMPVDEYLPYIGVGHIVYTFVSQTINESTGVFVADARMYMNDKVPFQLSIASHVYKSMLVFMHNIPTIIILVLWSVEASFKPSLSFFSSIILLILFTYTSCYFVAVLCTRFRDLTQIVGLIMQVSFLITPVMWQMNFVPQEYHAYVMLNPFAAILECVRNPILGIPVADYAMESLICWTLLACFLSGLVYTRLNKNLIFWV